MINLDWRQGPYMAPGKNQIWINDFALTEFSLETFSRTVSAIWDWDLAPDPVLMSTAACLLARPVLQKHFGKAERFTLEALIWEGWDLPAVWFRAGNQVPEHSWLGTVPVRTKLSRELDQHKMGWVVPSACPVKYPAYCRAFLFLDEDYVDPLAGKLQTILDEWLDQQDEPLDLNCEHDWRPWEVHGNYPLHRGCKKCFGVEYPDPEGFTSPETSV